MPTIICPALDAKCPDCPAISLCQLVAGGWEISYTPALDNMPAAPAQPETRPVALTAPIESPIPPPNRRNGAPYKRIARGQIGFKGMGKY